jgi:hypothetical protein
VEQGEGGGQQDACRGGCFSVTNKVDQSQCDQYSCDSQTILLVARRKKYVAKRYGAGTRRMWDHSPTLNERRLRGAFAVVNVKASTP